MILGKKALIMLLVISSIFVCCCYGQTDDTDGDRTTGERIASAGVSEINMTDMSAMQALRAAGLTTFANLAVEAGIADELDGEGTFDAEVLGGLGGGPYSVFAPTNDAFDRIPNQTWNEIRESAGDLSTIVEHHVVDGTDIGQRGETIGAAEGGSVDIVTSEDRVVGVNNATVLRTIPYRYGIIYEINHVLLPDDQALIDRYDLGTVSWDADESEPAVVDTETQPAV